MENDQHDVLVAGDVSEPAFAITDDKTANWVVKKIVEARTYRGRVKRWAEAEIARSERDEERLLYVFGTQLEEWVRVELGRRGGRSRSVNLPAGRLGFRRTRPRLIIENAAAVVAWARDACPSAVIVVEKLSRSELMNHFAATGEVPPSGARLEGGEDHFFVS